ncbi:histidine kinase [Cellulophaga sp. HaHaR_3_176]|uniref:tetratricopeptide repeat-containing sensor histidine kinase n=1 Tax=Cellulophaga sp. HaHaR_3_176 TaxID=1942464 RepID=UPI001C1FE243|nr:histidine kinase [Cellulophaga sp. HaHaR_3_176]QWX84825.1 histidine kinase [Cellulophaga sp. HaHaR_3_176]
MNYSFLFKLIFYPLIVLVFFSCSQSEKVTKEFTVALNVIDSLTQQDGLKAIGLLDSIQLKFSKITPEQEALLYFKKGELYYINNLYSEAIAEHKNASALFIEQQDVFNNTRCLITLSAANLRLENIEKAQEYALEALHNSEKLNDKRLLAKANNQLFQLHYALEDYPKAMQFILEANHIFSDQKDTVSIISLNNNIAALHLKQKQFNKALATYQESLKLGQNIKSPQMIVKILNNIGYTYIEAEKYELAIQFLKGAIQVNKNISAVNAAPHKGLGYVYFLQNDILNSQESYKEALRIYKKDKNIPEQIQILDKLITLAIKSEDSAKALKYQIVRDQLQIEHQIKEKERLLHFATIKYKAKKKEVDLAYQKQLNKKNNWLYGVLIVVLLLLLILIATYFYASKLKAANKASALEQRVLRAQMNPHFIFNTLAAIQNITLDRDPLKASNYISKFSKLIRQNFDYVRKEEISLEQEISMLENYIETQQLRFNHSFSYHLILEDDAALKNLKVPPMLLQPFLENAIEYGLKDRKSGGTLKLQILKEGNALCFIITDNGIGRSLQAKKLENPTELHATAIFIERLKLRKKTEEKTFKIEDLYDLDGHAIGTKVSFKIYYT